MTFKKLGKGSPQRHKDTKVRHIGPVGSRMRNDAYEPITYETEVAAREVVDAAYKVHSGLGPGLLEGVYEVCLCHELAKRNISFKNQIGLPVIYDGLKLDA